jgi:hypothetical protein
MVSLSLTAVVDQVSEASKGKDAGDNPADGG